MQSASYYYEPFVILNRFMIYSNKKLNWNIHKSYLSCSLTKHMKFMRTSTHLGKHCDYDEKFCDVILIVTYTCTQRGKNFMTTKIVVNKRLLVNVL